MYTYVLNGAGQWGICIINLNRAGQQHRCMCSMEQVSGAGMLVVVASPAEHFGGRQVLCTRTLTNVSIAWG